MKFFIRLFAEILTVSFVVFTTTKLINSGHTKAGVAFAAICTVILALRATIQSEHIKDDARERRRLEKAFVTAVEDASWPHLVTVHHDRKVVPHYIETPDFRSVDDAFYIETPLSEESLDEQTQLVDLLSPEGVDAFYSDDGTEKEVNTNTAAEDEE